MPEIFATNHTDELGYPAGGSVSGIGLSISWQDGPRAQLGDEQLAAPNGAFIEDVIEAAAQRLEYFQRSEFRCRENAIAITKLEEALLWLGKRTADRAARGVEGTHVV